MTSGETNNMTPREKSLPERVAVLETIVPSIKDSMDGLSKTLNTVNLQVNTLVTNVQTITTERSRWKDPMLYVTAASVLIAGYAVIVK